MIPVQGLRLTKAVNYEFTVNRVTFIDAKKIAHRRKRFGFPTTLSALKLKCKGTLDLFIEEHKTFAILKSTGSGQALVKQCFDITKEELSILSLSQLGYNRRRHNSKPSVYYNENPEAIAGIMQNTTVTDTSYITKDKVGKTGPLNLSSGKGSNLPLTAC